MLRRFSTLLLLLCILLLESCQKEADFALTNSNNAVTGDFRAKIDGTQWVANKVASASRIRGLINLTGISIDKKILTITLTDSGVHRYILSDVTGSAGAYVDSSSANTFSFTTNQGVYPGECGGELTITSIDTVNKKMSGTFFFKAFRQMDGASKNFTEGSFTNISYATTLPPSNSTDTMRAKINGVMWQPPVIYASVSPAVPPLASMLVISGTDMLAVKTLGLMIPPTITPGSYTLDFFGLQYIGQYNPDADPMHSQASMSGTVTILEHNTSTHRIRGNFNFHAEALVDPLINSEITEGYFSVKY